MKAQILREALIRHGGATRDGDAVVIPNATEASLYVALATEPLVIDRVVRVTFEPEALLAATRRHERYVVAYDDVRAVRMSDAAGARAGYSG